jgi:hypothetical protein
MKDKKIIKGQRSIKRRRSIKPKRRHSIRRRTSNSKQYVKRTSHKISKKNTRLRGTTLRGGDNGIAYNGMGLGGVTDIFTSGQILSDTCEGKPEYDCRIANKCYWGLHSIPGEYRKIYGCKSGNKRNQPFADSYNGTGNGSSSQSSDYIKYIKDYPMTNFFRTTPQEVYDWIPLPLYNNKYYIKGPSRSAQYY